MPIIPPAIVLSTEHCSHGIKRGEEVKRRNGDIKGIGYPCDRITTTQVSSRIFYFYSYFAQKTQRQLPLSRKSLRHLYFIRKSFYWLAFSKYLIAFIFHIMKPWYKFRIVMKFRIEPSNLIILNAVRQCCKGDIMRSSCGGRDVGVLCSSVG